MAPAAASTYRGIFQQGQTRYSRVLVTKQFANFRFDVDDGTL